MQLICGMLGHQPAPLRTRRKHGIPTNRCVLCQQVIERRPGQPGWVLAGSPDAGPG